MQFGIDAHGNRVSPFKGGRSFCPICEGTLIAKCGDIYRYHWQHAADRNCDPWKEHETAWHRNWKSRFPERWRERIIEQAGEKHIADVMTADGMVIEFQNSPISMETIAVREDFYEEMIWVVNAKAFAKNFTISSVVSTKLRQLEKDYRAKKLPPDASSQEERALQKALSDVSYALRVVSSRIDCLLKETFKIDDTFSDLGRLAAETITYWRSGSGKPSYPFHQLESSINDLYQAHQRNRHELKSADQRIADLNQYLTKIADLQTYEHQHVRYAIVNYSSLNKNNYHHAIAIKKTSIATMFPEVRPFDSEMTMHSFKFKTDDHYFGLDPSTYLTKAHSEIQEQQATIESIKNKQLELEDQVENQLRGCLTQLRDEANHNLTMAVDEQSDLYGKEITLDEQLEALQSEEMRRFLAAETETEEAYKKQKYSIMNEFKGLYRFRWKNERKSWSEAYSPLYFDIGKDYLFKRVDDQLLRKISINDFLSTHLKT